MKKKYTINITKKDIKDGVRFDVSYCPIAIAAKRSTGLTCAVNNKVCDVFDGVNHRYFLLPDRASTFVNAFDDKETVKPFKFAMKL